MIPYQLLLCPCQLLHYQCTMDRCGWKVPRGPYVTNFANLGCYVTKFLQREALNIIA